MFGRRGGVEEAGSDIYRKQFDLDFVFIFLNWYRGHCLCIVKDFGM